MRSPPRPENSPRLIHWMPNIYSTDDPEGLAAVLRTIPGELAEWTKRAQAPGSIELTRFYLKRSDYKPAPYIIIERAGGVRTGGPDVHLVDAILDVLVAPPAPQLPPAVVALAELAGETIGTSCDGDCVRALWKRAARRLHPDAGGDAEKFIAARAAYEAALAVMEVGR